MGRWLARKNNSGGSGVVGFRLDDKESVCWRMLLDYVEHSIDSNES